MLLALSALVVGTMAALVQSESPSQAASASSPVVHSVSKRDSSRALRIARRAQGEFETNRRRLLPFEIFDGGGDCDAIVGRYCHRQQFTSPPDESPAIVAARMRLLKTLDSVGTLLPGDRWIVGQRVRYLMEAGRPLDADSIAIACAARSAAVPTSGWCLALVGYTAQQLGNYPRADAAFASALEQMSPAERCRWEDLSLLLGRAAAPYRGDCQTRDSVAAGFWRFVQPLYLRSVNDLRTEFLARVTRMYIEQDTRTPMTDWWGPEERATLLRYGVPLWYTQGEIPRGETRPQIAGFRREPAFDFFPDAHAFSSPDELTDEDWEFSNPQDAPTYAPLWAVGFQPITDHQVSLFRRGDSALVVAAFDLDGSPRNTMRRAGVFAAVIEQRGVLSPRGTTVEPAGAGVVSTLVAPWRSMVISLEALDSATGMAQRARFARKLPRATGRLSLSDLLLCAPGDSAPASLSDAIPRALHALRAPSDRQLGVFWETYGAGAEAAGVDYALAVAPADEGFVHRALVKLRVMEPERAISVQWHDVPAFVDGVAARGMTVDLSRLRPGRYSVRLTLTSGTEPPVVSERGIEIGY